jgi:formylglycine-generating enzyme required for sulfatase activity
VSQLQIEFPRGEVLSGRFEIIDRVHRSPLGVTYRVKGAAGTTGADRPRLLTVLDPEIVGKDAKDALLEAVRASRGFTEPHMLKVQDLGSHSGVAWVTMDDFDGRWLPEILAERKAKGEPFTLREAAQIVNQLLEVCRVAADAGRPIRALRPEHILVQQRRTGPGGKSVLFDVRVPWVGLWDLVPVGTLAEDEFSRGEAQYIAPELKSFNPKSSPRVDLFSVGVIFYELLVGQPPQGTFQLPRQRRPELPKLVDNVTHTALAPAPEDRFAHARAFATALQEVFEDEPEPAVAASAPGMNRAVLGLSALLIIAVALLLYRMSADPTKAFEADDNAQRNALREKHPPVPPPEQLMAMMKEHGDMVPVPGGPFLTGRLRQEKVIGEPVLKEVELPGFLIDMFEYPNKKGAEPKRSTPFAEAEKLCTDQGKRLCSADELEKACKGSASLVYGYGDKFDAAKCGEGTEQIQASGSRPDCKSSWGVYDLAGNLREWTSSSPAANRVMVKGGLPMGAAKGTRCAYGSDQSITWTDATVGFRCCKDLPP